MGAGVSKKPAPPPPQPEVQNFQADRSSSSDGELPIPSLPALPTVGATLVTEPFRKMGSLGKDTLQTFTGTRAEGEDLQLPSPAELQALEEPFTKQDEGKPGVVCKCIFVIPHDVEIRKKSPKIVLEVSSMGFRLLRPETNAPISLYAWGQIHSWAYSSTDFAFRYFDEGKGKLVQHSFGARDTEQILEQIQTVIDRILSERKSLAVSSEAFARIMKTLESTDPSQRVDVLAELTKENYFFSAQGTQIMRLLPSEFDKVDAAVMLHSRLVDQTGFSKMLEDSNCQGDKENIWHRITALRKNAALAKGSRKPR